MATPLKVNRIGLEPQIYKGGKTTLCAGCGHNSISERIIEAFYEMGMTVRLLIELFRNASARRVSGGRLTGKGWLRNLRYSHNDNFLSPTLAKPVEYNHHEKI